MKKKKEEQEENKMKNEKKKKNKKIQRCRSTSSRLKSGLIRKQVFRWKSRGGREAGEHRVFIGKTLVEEMCCCSLCEHTVPNIHFVSKNVEKTLTKVFEFKIQENEEFRILKFSPKIGQNLIFQRLDFVSPIKSIKKIKFLIFFRMKY